MFMSEINPKCNYSCLVSLAKCFPLRLSNVRYNVKCAAACSSHYVEKYHRKRDVWFCYQKLRLTFSRKTLANVHKLDVSK